MDKVSHLVFQLKKLAADYTYRDIGFGTYEKIPLKDLATREAEAKASFKAAREAKSIPSQALGSAKQQKRSISEVKNLLGRRVLLAGGALAALSGGAYAVNKYREHKLEKAAESKGNAKA